MKPVPTAVLVGELALFGAEQPDSRHIGEIGPARRVGEAHAALCTAVQQHDQRRLFVVVQPRRCVKPVAPGGSCRVPAVHAPVPPSRRLLADPPGDRGSPRVDPHEHPAPQRTQVMDHRGHHAAAPEKRPSSDVCSGLGCLVDPHSREGCPRRVCARKPIASLAAKRPRAMESAVSKGCCARSRLRRGRRPVLGGRGRGVAARA